MGLQWHSLDQGTYEDNRFNFILTVEESGTPKTTPYIDSAGIPTIGIGFNLRARATFNQAVTEIFYPGAGQDQFLNADASYVNQIQSVLAGNWSGGSASRLQSSLDSVMKARSQDAAVKVAGKRASFGFTDTGEIKTVFNRLAATFEGEIDNWHADIPPSTERVSLFSLAWNAFSLLGNELKTAIAGENRPEAWYQIRYDSNDGLNGPPGLAKRRYFESQFFNLYDAGTLDPTQAQAIIAMVSSHQAWIDTYDQAFGRMVSRAVSDYRAPVQTTAQAIAPAKALIAASPLSATMV
jgi:hypothetical protein